MEKTPGQPTQASAPLTDLIQRARDGNDDDLNSLVSAVYRELRRTAQGMLSRESVGHTLVATDLVHEAFLRLFGDQGVSWENRRHFFGSAAIAMRRILIDHARKKRSGKRIPKEEMLPIEAADAVLEMPNVDLIALDEALRTLEAKSPRQARIVELRFFAGLTEAEVSDVLEISRMTVSRDWKVARLRLLQYMGS